MPFKIQKFTQEGIHLVDEEGSIVRLEHVHDQDCCEEVYADWSQLEDQVGIEDAEFGLEPEVETVEGSGFRLKDLSGTTFFVPCYNIQNGYYSDELSLELLDKDGDELWSKDLSDSTCTSQHFSII